MVATWLGNELNVSADEAMFTEAVQTNIGDVYSIFNTSRMAIILAEQLCQPSSITAALDVTLPILKLLLFTLKSVWDCVTILATFSYQAKGQSLQTTNVLDAAIVHIADETVSSLSLLKRLSQTVLSLGMMVSAIALPNIAIPLLICNIVIAAVNDLVSIRYHQLAKTALLQDSQRTQAALTGAITQVDLQATTASLQRILRTKQHYAESEFGIIDRSVRLAVGGLFTAGMLCLLSSAPIQLVAYATFISTSLASMTYYKCLRDRQEQACINRAEKSLAPVYKKAAEKFSGNKGFKKANHVLKGLSRYRKLQPGFWQRSNKIIRGEESEFVARPQPVPLPAPNMHSIPTMTA